MSRAAQPIHGLSWEPLETAPALLQPGSEFVGCPLDAQSSRTWFTEPRASPWLQLVPHTIPFILPGNHLAPHLDLLAFLTDWYLLSWSLQAMFASFSLTQHFLRNPSLRVNACPGPGISVQALPEVSQKEIWWFSCLSTPLGLVC